MRLKTGEEYLWRPVLAGLCQYRDIKDSILDLCDVATMNELLDIQRSNDRRIEEARQRQRELEARQRR